MNLTSLLAKTRYLLDDDNTSSPQRWSDTELTSYLNESYRFYYNKLVAVGYDGLLKKTTLDIVASTDTVSLPSDWFKTKIIYRTVNNIQYPLNYVRNYEYAIDNQGVGNSFYLPAYDHRGKALVLYPTPSFSETGGIIIEYFPVITEMSSGSDTTAAGFSEQWHDLLPLRAALWGKGGREEDDVSNLSGMLKDTEESFNDTIDKMTNARSFTTPFITDYGYRGY